MRWWLDHCCGQRLHSAPAIEERIWYWMPMDWRFTRLCCTLWLGENPCQSISCKHPLFMVPCCCYWFEIIWKSMWNITWMKYTYTYNDNVYDRMLQIYLYVSIYVYTYFSIYKYVCWHFCSYHIITLVLTTGFFDAYLSVKRRLLKITPNKNHRQSENIHI